MDRWPNSRFLRPQNRWSLLLVVAALTTCTLVRADALPPDCGELSNTYGPYDYTDPLHFREKLPVVEQYHFSKEQELSTYRPGSKTRVDFGYTLRAFPNHHRALMALTRWLKLHKPEDWSSEMRAECYFHRALAWRPRDSVARMIYGLYLHQNQRLKEAEFQYQTALKIQPDYAEGHYNLGLLYTEQKRWSEALGAAHKAYALNYPLPGLKKRLVEAKQWKDPQPTPVAPASENLPPSEVPAAADADSAKEPALSHPPSKPTSEEPTPGTPP